jgi:acetyl esterase/lipase
MPTSRSASPESERVDIEEGVVFGHTGERDLACDVFRPPASKRNGRGILLVHGGGWVRGDRAQLRGYGVLLGRLGYTCVAGEYRLAAEAKHPAALHDVKAALRFMHAERKSLGIDENKIIVSGNSAGAHLALLAAASQNDPALEGESGNANAPTTMAAVVGIYPPTRMSANGAPLGGMVREYLGPDASLDDALAASPLHVAHAGFPPTLLIHGNADDIVPVGDSQLMYEALVAAGVTTEMHVFADAPHAFDAEPLLGRQCASLISLFIDRQLQQ